MEDERVVMTEDSVTHGQISDGSDRRQLWWLVMCLHCLTSFGLPDSPVAGSGDRVWVALEAGVLEQASCAEDLEEPLHVLLRLLLGDVEGVDQGLGQLLRGPFLGEVPDQHRPAAVGGQVRGRSEVEKDQVAVDLSPGDVVNA
jgi:hypothetical protein